MTTAGAGRGRTVVLTQDDVPALLPMADCITALAGAFGQLARGEARLPLRTVVRLPGDQGRFGIMPAALGAPAWFGLKAIGVLPANAGTGHDSHPGAVLLFEPAHGRLVAVIDASTVTALRTAAASGLATRLLARPDAALLALLGAGVEAWTHLEAMRAVRPVRAVRVWSRSADRARRFAARAAQRTGLPVVAMADAEAAVRGADLVCTVTAARTPVLHGAWLAPGCHVNAVGASQPDARELDSDAMRRGRIYVDVRESALAESGDLRMAVAEGAIGGDAIVAELAELVSGRAAGRGAAEEITIFDSLGVAIEDLAAAQALYARANATGAGTWLEFGGWREETG